jgi:RNA polymerase sigma-70 factor, ECF subfamily
MDSTATMRAATPAATEQRAGQVEGLRSQYGLLARRHQARLRRAVAHILRDRSEVEDVVQQALLVAYSALASFSGAAPFASWLTRIAVNEALLRARQAGRQQQAVAALAWSTGPAGDPEQEAGWREDAARVRAALRRLPGRHREALCLAADELSGAEIAAALGIRLGAAKVRVHRARGALRTLLAQAAPARPGTPRLALAPRRGGRDGRGGQEAPRVEDVAEARASG